MLIKCSEICIKNKIEERQKHTRKIAKFAFLQHFAFSCTDIVCFNRINKVTFLNEGHVSLASLTTSKPVVLGLDPIGS